MEKTTQIGIRFDAALHRRVSNAAVVLGVTKGKGNPNMSKTAEILVRRGLLGLGGNGSAASYARTLAQDFPDQIDAMIAAMIAVADDYGRKGALVDGE